MFFNTNQQTRIALAAVNECIRAIQQSTGSPLVKLSAYGFEVKNEERKKLVSDISDCVITWDNELLNSTQLKFGLIELAELWICVFHHRSSPRTADIRSKRCVSVTNY